MSEADLSSELNFDKKKKKKKTLALDLDEDSNAAELSSLEQRASKKFSKYKISDQELFRTR